MDSVIRRETSVFPNEISIEEWEEKMFSAEGPLLDETEEDKTCLFVDWNMFGDNKRRCKGCDKYKKEKGYGDFICKHVKGFREAPAHVRRCTNCNAWKKDRGIKGDFWCKHRKRDKKIWDDHSGWEGASERARDISEIYGGR
jgi:hypothetical protein